MLGVERYAATASDTSASVARASARRRRCRQDGAVTAWDDAGRPNAPVAEVESAPATRSTSAARRVARTADCCSNSGCDAVEATRDITGDIFGDWIGTFHHRVYWCWSIPEDHRRERRLLVDRRRQRHQRPRLRRLGQLLQLARQRPRRACLVSRRATGSNCMFYFGCFQHIYPVDRDLGQRQRRLGPGSRRLRSQSSKSSRSSSRPSSRRSSCSSLILFVIGALVSFFKYGY